MASDLIINAAPGETRVALLENGAVVELYIERAGERSIAGNIYKGRVVRVLPGMQAAFVDIGLDKAAFLYVSDVYDNVDEMAEVMIAGGGGVEADDPESERAGSTAERDIHIEDRLQ
jgi:ribonuclease G